MSPSVKSLLVVLAAVLASATAAPFSAVREGHASVAGVPLAHVPDQLRFPPGEVGTKIVGGVEVQPPFAFEWITPLKHKSYGQFCAGTLIAPNWVLTAAHCSVLGYPLAQLEISAHRHDLRKTAASEQGADYNIAAIYVHPDYDSWDISNDVALWKLASPVTVASPIWSIDRTGTASTPGLLAKTLGWGAVRENGASSSVLLEVDVPIIDQAVCNADYYVNQIHSTHLCAGYPDVGGKDACQGDSGGPLITFDSDSNPVLVGITSWGYGCARRGYPGVYTNVTSVSSWVDATILKHTSF